MSENDVKTLIREVSKSIRKSLLWVLIPILVPSFLGLGWVAISDHFLLKNKQDTLKAYEYWTNIQLLVERKTALFEQYVIGDTSNHSEILRRMGIIEDEIRYIHRNYNPTRAISEDEGPDILGQDYVNEVALPALGVK